jgi:hypothetical protein
MKNIRTKKLYGIGINDADYVVKIQESYYVEGLTTVTEQLFKTI